MTCLGYAEGHFDIFGKIEEGSKVPELERREEGAGRSRVDDDMH